MIRFESVSYRYPHQHGAALRQFTWQVENSAFALVAGPSGSGKSTIIRCLNGLIPHFHGGAFGGRLTIFGSDTREQPPSRLSRLTGLVSQFPEAQTVMDRVEDEIAFGPENHGLARDDIRRRVEESLDLLGIAPLRNREIATLSGGERQRVVIASAMAMQPPLLALDEPLSQLDPWGAGDVVAALERLQAERGTTIILAEHRLERLFRQAAKLLVLGPDGAILADGTAREAAGSLIEPPPLIRLGRALGWDPLPLTIAEAKQIISASRIKYEALAPPPETPPVTGPALVELEDVSFTYGRQAALQSITATIRGGLVTALMGRNGSGKTTLLRHMNGLLRPRSGRVRLQGSDITNVATSALARLVGYLPQHPAAMLFNPTVADELRFTLRCLGCAGDIAGTLVELGLEHLAERNPFDLSGGERQRAALAAVLVGQPSVLLLDEPTRGMDYARKAELAALLRRLSGAGMAIVLATHDADLVAACAGRVIVLEDGKIAADGTPRDVLASWPGIATQINQVFGGRFLVPEDLFGSPNSDSAGPRARIALAPGN
ncbi:MAG TPA: ABC transporter ATP-binding protein [Nitrolancea sp.]|nr:ABC transporter ATP-binding protein [Nitrolancea sp.]